MISHGRCFLCSPNPDLLYSCDDRGIAVCGLGPLVPGYSVLAATNHIPSAADALAGSAPQFVDFVSDIRALLAHRFGRCLLTEHGRIPLCVRNPGSTDPHCHHAHFLAFPDAPSVEETARGYFGRVLEASDLHEALRAVPPDEQYFLLSPEPSRVLILTQPAVFIRQFARHLVAQALDRPGAADWRQYSQLEHAKRTTVVLRMIVEEIHACQGQKS